MYWRNIDSQGEGSLGWNCNHFATMYRVNEKPCRTDRVRAGFLVSYIKFPTLSSNKIWAQEREWGPPLSPPTPPSPQNQFALMPSKQPSTNILAAHSFLAHVVLWLPKSFHIRPIVTQVSYIYIRLGSFKRVHLAEAWPPKAQATLHTCSSDVQSILRMLIQGKVDWTFYISYRVTLKYL